MLRHANRGMAAQDAAASCPRLHAGPHQTTCGPGKLHTYSTTTTHILYYIQESSALHTESTNPKNGISVLLLCVSHPYVPYVSHHMCHICVTSYVSHMCHIHMCHICVTSICAICVTSYVSHMCHIICTFYTHPHPPTYPHPPTHPHFHTHPHTCGHQP